LLPFILSLVVVVLFNKIATIDLGALRSFKSSGLRLYCLI